MNTTQILPGLDELVKPFKFNGQPYEYKVVPLRERPTLENLQLCDTPQKAADYWRMHVASNPYFNPECECFTVLLFNTRRRVKAHQIVSMGTHDTILVHPLTVFRLAVVTSAAALVLTHNHSSPIFAS
jgi:DNA repair protein RadC